MRTGLIAADLRHRTGVFVGTFVSVCFGVLGRAEPEPGIEIDGALDVRGEAIEVIEALRVTSGVGRILLEQARRLVEREAELQRHAGRIVDLQRAALEGLFDPGTCDAQRCKMRMSFVQILFAADFEPEPLAC